MNNSPWIDEKYIGFIVSQLELGEQVNSGQWNARCPVCGDSQKNQSKRRFYISQHQGDYMCSCFNCEYRASFKTFMKDFFSVYFDDYRKEKFMEDGSSSRKPSDTPVTVPKSKAKVKLFHQTSQDSQKLMLPVSSAPIASKYLQYREVPKDKWRHFGHTYNYRQLLERAGYKDFKKITEEPMMVITLLSPKGDKITGFQGRSYKKSGNGLRYSTNKMDDNACFIPGDLNYSETISITEGVYDALMVRSNCCAALSSNLMRVQTIIGKDCKYRYIFDNEPYNGAIVAQVKKAVMTKSKIFIADHKMGKFKDLNDIIVSKYWTLDELNDYIDSRTFSYPISLYEFNKWKKV